MRDAGRGFCAQAAFEDGLREPSPLLAFFNEDLYIRVPFVHGHERRPQLAIKPLDLAKDEPNQVCDSGARWTGRAAVAATAPVAA